MLGDVKQEVFNLFDLVTYINTARKHIAAQGQCVRYLAGATAGVQSIKVTNGGSGYTNPIVAIIPPGGTYTVTGGQIVWKNTSGLTVTWYNSGSIVATWLNGQTINVTDVLGITDATATATIVGGVITGITVTSPGGGYPSPPTVVIVDPTGTGATAIATLFPINQTVAGQEVYQFSDVFTDPANGVGEIFVVKSVSLLWGTWRYMTVAPSFSKYQAWVRTYTNQYLYIPFFCANYGQGDKGSLYMYPLPSTVYPMEWDCLCLPLPLKMDTDPEAIPFMWTECVPYFAAYLALLGAQQYEKANFMKQTFDEWMHRARAYSQPGRWSNPYGRP
ncbi:hypothetical protein KGP36_06155 [Patescibacteria group bacterium]|nr:hypothetical protein [Patescibacteria group bacterium]